MGNMELSMVSSTGTVYTMEYAHAMMEVTHGLLHATRYGVCHA